MKAIAVSDDGAFGFMDVSAPEPTEDKVIVRPAAVSINRGEVLRAKAFGAGFRPGWDFAGTVENTVRNGPEVGSRVAGYLHAAAWAEQIAVPPNMLADIPQGVSFEQAAALPVAGLTALGAVDSAGSLLGRKVLVTGASGGVGSFAANLAALAGADVTAVVRRPAEGCSDLLRLADRVLSLRNGLAGAGDFGPYDLVVETLGGDSLTDALTMLGPTGRCVLLGVTDAPRTEIDAERFFMTGSAILQGYVLFRDRSGSAVTERLSRLLHLVARKGLPADVSLTAGWGDINRVADRLIERSFVGKAVLSIG